MGNKNEQNQNWYAVITSRILCATDISANQKLLIALINNLSNEKKACFASNGYLGDLLGIKKDSVRKLLKDLEVKGYIKQTIKYKPDFSVEFRNIRTIERTDNPTSFDTNTPPIEKSGTPPSKTADIKTKFNNKLVNNKEEKTNVKTQYSTLSNIDNIDNIDTNIDTVLGIRNWLKNNNRVFDKYINGPNDLIDNLSYKKGDVDKKVNYLLNNSIEVLELYPN